MLPEQVLTVEEVAKYLRVPVDAIQAEIASGRLPGVSIAGHVRVREFELAHYLNEARMKAVPESTRPRNDFRMTLHPAPDFPHRWPDGSSEAFNKAAEGIASFEGIDYQVKVGFTIRTAAGQPRARALILINRYPSVEFVAASAEVGPGSKMASIIRDRKGKQLPPGADVPPEYEGKAIGPYRSVVDGPGARNGIAVICESQDLRTMVEHGVIRYRYRDERE